MNTINQKTIIANSKKRFFKHKTKDKKVSKIKTMSSKKINGAPKKIEKQSKSQKNIFSCMDPEINVEVKEKVNGENTPTNIRTSKKLKEEEINVDKNDEKNDKEKINEIKDDIKTEETIKKEESKEVQKEETQNEVKKEKIEDKKDDIKIDNNIKEDNIQNNNQNIKNISNNEQVQSYDQKIDEKLPEKNNQILPKKKKKLVNKKLMHFQVPENEIEKKTFTKLNYLQYSRKTPTKDQNKKSKKTFFKFNDNIKKTRKKNKFDKIMDKPSIIDKKNDINSKTLIAESKSSEKLNKSDIKNLSLNEEIHEIKNPLPSINIEEVKNINNNNEINQSSNYNGFILIKQEMGKKTLELKIDNNLEELNKILINKKVLDSNNDQLELINAKDMDKLRDENNKLLEEKNKIQQENENLQKELLYLKQKQQNPNSNDNLNNPVTNNVSANINVVSPIQNKEEKCNEKKEIAKCQKKTNENGKDKKELKDIEIRIEKYKKILNQEKLTVGLMNKPKKKNLSQDNTVLNKKHKENYSFENLKKSKKVNLKKSNNNNNSLKFLLKKRDNIEINKRNVIRKPFKKNDKKNKTFEVEDKKTNLSSKALDRINRRIATSQENVAKKQKDNDEIGYYKKSTNIMKIAKELEKVYNKNPKVENNNAKPEKVEVINGNAEELIAEKPVQKKMKKKPKITSF